MKIVHFNTLDFQGGAAKGAYRLHKVTLDKGINSAYYVQHKELLDNTIYSKERPYDKLMKQVIPFVDRSVLKMFYNTQSNAMFSSSFFSTDKIENAIDELKPDIIHLHWICGSFIDYYRLRKIRIPIVWTMHDSWIFTGGCHLPNNCYNYTKSCGYCPKLHSNSENDISYKQLRKKKNAWKDLNITFVAPSTWLFDCAKSSSLLSECKVVNIPNLIDTSFFQPVNKRIAKQILGLNPDKKYILFGGVNSQNDPNKGYVYLIDSLRKLGHIAPDDFELLIMGMSQPGQLDVNFKFHFFDKIHDEISLKVLFSASDISIVPSLSENLSYMIMESMCMGTPVVAFDIGGNRDLIDHKLNGYLAQEKNTDEIVEGVLFLTDKGNTPAIINAAREKIVNQFDKTIVIEKYFDLYKTL